MGAGGGEGKWVGVELDKAGAGVHDGAPGESRYLRVNEAGGPAVSVAPGHTALMRPYSQPHPGRCAAARAKVSIPRTIARMWNKLDANEEDRHIKRGKDVRDVITGVARNWGRRG